MEIDSWLASLAGRYTDTPMHVSCRLTRVWISLLGNMLNQLQMPRVCVLVCLHVPRLQYAILEFLPPDFCPMCGGPHCQRLTGPKMMGGKEFETWKRKQLAITFLRVVPTLKHYSDIVSKYLTYHLEVYWHIYPGILSDILSGIYFDILSDSLSFYLAFIFICFPAYILTFFSSFYVASILTFSLTFFLAFHLASILTFFVAFYLASDSGSAHWDLELAVEVRQCCAESWSSCFRSGSAHWDLELAVEVRQSPWRARGACGWGARGWGPAVPPPSWVQADGRTAEVVMSKSRIYRNPHGRGWGGGKEVDRNKPTWLGRRQEWFCKQVFCVDYEIAWYAPVELRCRRDSVRWTGPN